MSLPNPSNPTLAGLEYVGLRPSYQGIVASEGRGIRIASTSSQTVPEVAFYFNPTALGSGGVVTPAIDIYDLANPISGDPIVRAFEVPDDNSGVVTTTANWQRVNADQTTIAAWSTLANQWVNEALVDGFDTSEAAADTHEHLRWTPPDHNGANIRFNGTGNLFDRRDGTTPVSPTNQRLVRVDILAWVRCVMFFDCWVQGFIDISGNNFYSTQGLAHPNQSMLFQLTFLTNPNALKRWRNSHIAGFNNGAIPWGIRLTPQVPTTQNVVGHVDVFALNVQLSLVPERRVSTGYLDIAGKGVPGWRRVTLLNPLTDAVASWSKTSGHNYIAITSLPISGGACSIATLDALNVFGHTTDRYGDGDIFGVRPSLDIHHPGLPLAEITNGQDWAPAFLILPAASVSSDGQPYAVQGLATISNTSTLQQRISTQASATYRGIRVVVATSPDALGNPRQNAALTATLKTTGGSTVLGPATINPSDVPADGKLHVIDVALSSGGNLSAGTTYVLELASASTYGWLTAYIASESPTGALNPGVVALATSIGQGGATDYATVDGVVTTEGDFPFAIAEIPATPTALTAVASSQANVPALTTTPPLVYFAHLTWAWSGTAFSYYEVQRLDDGNWNPIAYITASGTTAFNDYELPRGIVASYRVRTVNTAGVPSLWSATATVTVPFGSNECTIILASNFEPALAQAFTDDDSQGPRIWHQRQAEQRDVKDIYGSNYPVAFHKTNSRAESFKRRLVIGFHDSALISETVTPDHAVFDNLLDLIHDRVDLPYVTYADGWGNRWFCSAICADPERDEPGSRYFADVQFDQVTNTPTPVTI